EPHWSSLAYIPAAIFFAEKISEHKKKFISALTLNLLLFGVFIFHLLSPAFTETILKNKDPKYDITNELFGWDSVAENIEYIISSENIPAKEVLLLSNHYTMSGQLMFSTKSKYRVVCRGKRCNQFKIDDIQDESNFRLFIFVTDNRFTEIPPVYREGAIQQKLKVFRGEKRVRDFYLYIKKKINPSDKSAE
ncbi:MAG: hypothetical protein N3B13_10650, partial [Deltaproteobacteria bacterium]|nr:hypothetical protein [Deltaproteobacteria bacterium]